MEQRKKRKEPDLRRKKRRGVGAAAACMYIRVHGKTPAQALCEVICQAASWLRTGVCNPALCSFGGALAWAKNSEQPAPAP